MSSGKTLLIFQQINSKLTSGSMKTVKYLLIKLIYFLNMIVSD